MYSVLASSVFFFLLTTALGKLTMLTAKKNTFTRNKLSPFECGFDPLSMKTLSFSVRFFSIALVFLIFDVEISLILPISPCFMDISSPSSFMLLLSLFFILWVGTLQEWSSSSLDWKNY